uniref:Transmembrane protein 138 n=1 Tax=Hanusia phi TaxID=3032 RepID=A0A7S0F2Z3_9CRYP|mmetsp:Transcript_3703/g.9156  ORF Transcript_3703/g.9156 Transcript_3703/m.9156 type:complete len:340 (+) Transcript_3703:42-1061(+)
MSEGSRGGLAGMEFLTSNFTPLSVCVVLFLDVGLNSLMDPLSAQIGIVILLTCLQVSFPLCTVVLIFIMLTRTKFMRAGRFGDMLSRFRYLGITFPLYALFLIASKAYRIGAYSRFIPTNLFWTMDAYYPIYILEKIFSILYYSFVYQTLLQLGNPDLYVSSSTNEIEEIPVFCEEMTAAQLKAVPQILREDVKLEEINAAVRIINEFVIEKYQILEMSPKEIQDFEIGEEVLEMKKKWDSQQTVETSNVDFFTDQDLMLYDSLKHHLHQVLHVLVHTNRLSVYRTSRNLTMYCNPNRSNEFQIWVKKQMEKISLNKKDSKKDRRRTAPLSVIKIHPRA